jgi:hypothetical protein
MTQIYVIIRRFRDGFAEPYAYTDEGVALHTLQELCKRAQYDGDPDPILKLVTIGQLPEPIGEPHPDRGP